MFFKNDFANIIKNISNDSDNQRDFAIKSGINRNYLSRYMNLKMDKPPKPSILLKLADASNGAYSYMKLMQICGYINYNENDISVILFTQFTKCFFSWIVSSSKPSKLIIETFLLCFAQFAPFL